MSNPSPHVSKSSSVQPEPNQGKVNKLIIQASMGLILLFFAVLAMIILVNLPGAF